MKLKREFADFYKEIRIDSETHALKEKREILEDDIFLKRCKFIILTSLTKPGIGLISSSQIKPDNYINISLNLFSKNQMEVLFNQYQEISVDNDIMDYAFKFSEGNPAII